MKKILRSIMLGTILAFSLSSLCTYIPSVTTAASSKKNIKKQDNKKSAQKKVHAKKKKKKVTKKTTVQNYSIGLELTRKNSWKNGNTTFTQIDAMITNNENIKINKWTVLINVPKGSKINQLWNSTYTLKKDKLTFSPASYNLSISPKSNVTFGFIIETPTQFKDFSSKLTCDSETYAGTIVSNPNSSASNKKNSIASKSKKNIKQYTQSNNKSKTAVSAKQPKQLPIPKASTGDWLFTKGNKIVDKHGKQVWLTGINWFGYNTGSNIFDGLWAADLNKSIDSIANRGFNLLRVPISAELIKSWSKHKYPKANFNQATNSYLVGKNSLQIFDYVIGRCRADGLKIMIDIHSAKTDAMGHMYPVWYNGSISENDYFNALGWMASRYKKDDTIIAYDLKNEPHGKPTENPHAIWNNSTSPNNWKYIAEKAAKRVLKSNPSALIMVEGIEMYPINIKKNGNFKSTNSKDYYFNWWGGNLRGVADYPINLGKYQNKLVYSPHDYGPSVYKQPWFHNGYTFQSLYNDCWKDNWMFIYKKNISPILIGEWGGYMTEPNLTWMKYLRKLIIDNKLNHTFWCFNANSGDTGGMVKDDFVTWDEAKYKFVKPALWSKNGKFIGLDQEIPLGKNGIALDKLK